MLRGIYSATSSLLALLQRQEAMSHNLANLSTPGFKQEVIIAQEGANPGLVQDYGTRRSPTIGGLTTGVYGGETLIDFGQGPMENTERPFDLAITGEGFFRIETPDGVRLTRDGTFHRDSTGRIVTADGWALLGENGPIQVPEGDPFVAEDGSVFQQNNNTPLGRIALGTVADLGALVPQGDNLLDPGAAPVQMLAGPQSHIRQGYLEQSNVDVSGTVVGMMVALRSYEATQRSLSLQDQALQRTLEVGRMG